MKKFNFITLFFNYNYINIIICLILLKIIFDKNLNFSKIGILINN